VCAARAAQAVIDELLRTNQLKVRAAAPGSASSAAWLPLMRLLHALPRRTRADAR
jgi:hypothetical protein